MVVLIKYFLFNLAICAGIILLTHKEKDIDPCRRSVDAIGNEHTKMSIYNPQDDTIENETRNNIEYMENEIGENKMRLMDGFTIAGW